MTEDLPPLPKELGKIEQRRDQFISSLIETFERELNGVIAKAQAATLSELKEKLAEKDGAIDRTLANSAILRNLDRLFLDELNQAGYDRLLQSLIEEFPGQLPFFQETIQALSDAMKNPLPKMTWSARDLKLFSDQAFSTKDALEGIMESIAARAKQRILLSIGGLQFKDLATSFAEYVHRALPECVGLAETSAATYYRVIADRGYQVIEKDLPEMEIRYRYYGPYDLLIRPFCEHLMRVDKSYTRDQIDAMNNGQIPNVFISCGGWRCRHAWLIALQP